MHRVSLPIDRSAHLLIWERWGQIHCFAEEPEEVLE